MRLKDVYIIWVNYIDRKLSKKRGRRISKNKAVLKPTLEELEVAARNLGFQVILSKPARYPSSWWIKSGYIVIKRPNDLSKGKVIDMIAKEIRRRRGG